MLLDQLMIHEMFIPVVTIGDDIVINVPGMVH